MAELFEEVVALLESRSSTRALAVRFRIESQQAAGNAVALCIPVLLAELSHWSEDPRGSASLLKTLRTIDTFGLNDPGAAIESNGYEPVGSKLTDALLGDRRRSVCEAVATEAGIGRQNASLLFPPAAWAIITTIADRYGNRMGGQALSNVLNSELDGLIDAGWGPWLETVGCLPSETNSDGPYDGDYHDYGSGHERYGSVDTYGSVSSYDSVSSSDSFDAHDMFGEYGEHQLPANGRHDDLERYGAVPAYQEYRGERYDPVVTGDIAHYRGPARAEAPPSPAGRRSALESGPNAGLGQRHRADGPGPAERLPEEASPSRIPLILAGVAVLLLGVLGASQFLGDDRDDATAATTLDQPSQQAEESSPAGPDPFGEGVGGQGDSVDFDLIVSDPQGLSGAVGSLQLRFDVAAEEVCYRVAADLLTPPYDGHVHAGAAGQTGEVIVGFGQLDDGDFGCTQVDGARISRILNDRANHYVELHDAPGVVTIRAQLSEATDAAADSDIETGEGQPVAGVQYDPRGDGAFFGIEAGRLTLTGAVADQETADRMVAEFADLAGSGLEVVSELTVAADAPPPSGRFTMDNEGLFQLGSDQLSPERSSVIADLATVLVARPTWRVTIIGHTDATGSEELNLSLSLGRARAVLAELVASGVAEDKVTADGAGSSQPIADNATPEGQAQNRRIELIVDRG